MLWVPKTLANQLKEFSTPICKRDSIDKKTLYDDPLESCNLLIWLLIVLMSATYLMFLNASYGNEVSRVFLNVDQAFFKSIIHSLEKQWHLFPASLENISNVETPYHNLDSQIKYLFTLILPTNHAIFFVNILIYSFLGYSIFKLNIPPTYSILLFMFAFSVLKLPSPGEILQMVRLPLDFPIKSDLFHNSNTILALAFLTFIWNRRLILRLAVYALSFYIKSPAIPAFFMIEVYLLFFSDHQNQKSSPLTHRVLTLLVVTLIFVASYCLFFYNPVDGLSSFVSSVSWISFRIRHDIVWLANGVLLYDLILLCLTIRFSVKSKNQILIYFYYLLVGFLLLYDSVGLIKINIRELGQVEFFLRYALLMIILHLNSNIQIKWFGARLFNWLVFCIVIFNCYLFAHFLGALISDKYTRFSEYVDNSHLIEIASSISNENDIVAFNTIDSPIRKGKQLQLCGIIKNPLWVSNLRYVPVSIRTNVKTDWRTLNQALAGKIKFPAEIKWLILEKSKNNYNLKKICLSFTITKETDIYMLFKKNPYCVPDAHLK